MWVQAQSHSPDMPGGSKNVLDPVGIPLKKKKAAQAINLALLERVRAWRYGPLRLKEISIATRRCEC